MTTLVGYASAKGSTRGTAERIAAGPDSAGHDADLRSCAGIAEARDYEVVVRGSAIRNGQWLPAAPDMIDRLRPHLESKAVWASSVSSVGATSIILSPQLARDLRRATPEPRAVQELRATADVRDHRFFAGAIAPGDWPGVGRLVVQLMSGRYNDARDWPHIDRWTASLRAEASRGERR
ncbi:flavodoxin domain-containing protein [Rhodococcus jostii]|uniref:Menaquinone-dependent protoporphyrinogen oxidase n=1 Tax=Rhodococcus jostii TaxID=132919 RepID=A0A1H4TRW4_RHOJO|nr:flavodoxin domain-containing protein [Rhodococcus jostii]SEC59147.1 menaquinone-dependent protoporphyrinogen oxidase [Rhodococcus jostii]